MGDGFKQTEIEMIPQDWGVANLGDLADKLIGGGTPSTANKEYWDGDIHWTTSKIINNNNIFLFEGEKRITKKGLENSSTHVIAKNNLIIGTRVGVGKVAINKVDLAISQDLTGVFIDCSKYNSIFLAYQISEPSCQRFLLDCSRGTTIKGIPREDLARLILKIPPLPEQKKIAHVLSTIQTAKEKTEAVINAGKQLKKSMMKHLFTYGAVPIGEIDKVELKDTEIGLMPKEWKVVKLGEVINNTQYGLSVKGEKLGKYPILRMSNLNNGILDIKDLQYVNIPREEFIKFELHENDILFNRTNSLELVGKTSIFSSGNNFVFASYLIRVVCNNKELLSSYCNWYFNTEFAQARLKTLATRAVSQSNINATKLKSFLIPLPNIHEQMKTADILSTIDKKIHVEEDKLKSLDVLFKSMLQKLMTGQVRVKDLDIDGIKDAK